MQVHGAGALITGGASGLGAATARRHGTAVARVLNDETIRLDGALRTRPRRQPRHQVMEAPLRRGRGHGHADRQAA